MKESEKESGVWTVQKIIEWTTYHFASKKIESPRLDAELLLAKILQCNRIDLYLKFDQPLKSEELSGYKELVKRRALREPVAYILNEKEFYGRKFRVGPGVLIPRPETEHLIDEVVAWVKKVESKNQLNILDIGCGSGCIAVTLAAEIENSRVTAIDKSDVACSLTRFNAEAFGVESKVKVVQENFLNFSNGRESFDIVASNPPYISSHARESLSLDVKDFEPEEALFGGEGGFEVVEQWIPLCVEMLRPGGLLVFEIGYDQEEKALKLLNGLKNLDQALVIKDYSGHPRIAKALKTK